MPVTRLHPLPFPEPARFIAYVEEDPAVIEEGLRVVARRIPLPGAGPSIILDLLAVDGEERITAIQAGVRLTAQALASAASAHRWILDNAATLRMLCPPLAEASESVRTLLIAGATDPSLIPLLDRMAPPAPEVYTGSLFRTPAGVALSLRGIGRTSRGEGLSREAGAPGGAGVVAPPGRGAGGEATDPLAGLPISPAELAEFRRLVSSSRSRRPAARGGAGAAGPAPAAGSPPRAVVEN